MAESAERMRCFDMPNAWAELEAVVRVGLRGASMDMLGELAGLAVFVLVQGGVDMVSGA
jgi:hypothetical protein